MFTKVLVFRYFQQMQWNVCGDMNGKEVSEQDIRHLQIIRSSVDDFLEECAGHFDSEGKLLLDIAPQVHKGARVFFEKTSIRTLDIDPLSKADYIADICADNSELIGTHSFDYIVCTEVLEHTLQPFRAVEELFRILKPGGHVFLTVPFNFRIHGPLPDCWRFTEHGLRQLFNSFQILSLTTVETEDRFLMPVHYRLVAMRHG